jgi:hypothetical protein
MKGTTLTSLASFVARILNLTLRGLLSNLDTIGHSKVCHSIQDRALEHQFFDRGGSSLVSIVPEIRSSMSYS